MHLFTAETYQTFSASPEVLPITLSGETESYSEFLNNIQWFFLLKAPGDKQSHLLHTGHLFKHGLSIYHTFSNTDFGNLSPSSAHGGYL